MAEREIKKEIDTLKEELGDIRKELRARINTLKENILTGVKFIGIGLASIIGLRLVSKPGKILMSFLWKHKIICILLSVIPVGYYIFAKSQE